MNNIIPIIIGIAGLGFFIWLMIPSAVSTTSTNDSTGDDIIDASNPQQIGILIGLTGGSISDAAVARFALQRFEEIHGRKATMREVGMVVGLMSSMR